MQFWPRPFARMFGIFSRANSYIKSGFTPFNLWNASPIFNTYTEDKEKLQIAFTNPALLKVICLQCDLFSMGEFYVYNNDTERKNDPALERLANPNPLQSKKQWLWDAMFWKMLGNAHLYMDSNDVNRTNAPMYWLEPCKIEWPTELERQKDKLIFSQSKLNEVMNTEIIYRYEDGTTFKFPLSKMSTTTDLTNGVGNFFKGFSRVDSLYKIISNSEVTLDSTNINIRYTGKFLVSGQQDPKDVTKVPMSNTEKKDIEDKINGDTWDERFKGQEKQVHAVKSLVDIKRFLEKYDVIGQLDKSYLACYFLIGNMFGIPRDVLEAYQSSTFENQEKARAAHVSYTLDPAGQEICSMLEKRWGYTTKSIVLSWDHLPFVQVFEKDRISVKNQQVQTFNAMRKAGIPLNEINQFLDLNFTIDEKELERQQAAAGQQPKSGGTNGKTVHHNAGAVEAN